MDVESGRMMNAPTAHQVIEQEQQRLLARTQQLVFALVSLFFVFGMLPPSFVIWFLLALLLMMMWSRWTAPNPADALIQDPNLNLNLNLMDVTDLQQQLLLNHPLFLLASGGQVDIQNLRLSLMSRDFNEQDYEILLELDESNNSGPLRPLSDDDIQTLPLHKIKIIEDDNNNSCSNNTTNVAQTSNNGSLQTQEIEKLISNNEFQQICAICYEMFADKDEVRSMPCKHFFHEKCILPWLKYKGEGVTCPVCKRVVFEKNQSSSGTNNADQNQDDIV